MPTFIPGRQRRLYKNGVWGCLNMQPLCLQKAPEDASGRICTKILIKMLQIYYKKRLRYFKNWCMIVNVVSKHL